MIYKRTTWDDSDFQLLIPKLDNELRKNYSTHQDVYTKKNIIKNDANVIVCYENGKPVGCGCFRLTDDKSVVELKRMFVVENARGQGLGKKILEELENWAKELGHSVILLETGDKQIEAVEMYKKYGYTIIENYGEYKEIESSICMKKAIGK
jgi:putative acetyltransferase